MENISYISNSIRKNNEAKDYVNDQIEVEELELIKDLRKRKMKLLGLGSVYIVLFLLSFVILS